MSRFLSFFKNKNYYLFFIFLSLLLKELAVKVLNKEIAELKKEIKTTKTNLSWEGGRKLKTPQASWLGVVHYIILYPCRT